MFFTVCVKVCALPLGPMKKFDALIFDIGNVIIDIDFLIPMQEFGKLARVDFNEILQYNHRHHLFELFETGKLSEKEFHLKLRELLRPDVTDAEILAAWNSILVHYPTEKVQMLKQLKKTNRVLALSNINETHVTEMDRVTRERLGANNFSDFFHKAYYSHEVGLRKPDPAIYELVLKQENLNAANTFFVDDLPENIEAAKAIGLQAYHLKNPSQLQELLKELRITE